MSDYGGVYEERFLENLRRYASLRSRIKQCVEHVLANPYRNTEFLTDPSGKLDLRGCRSARVDRNFLIIFVVCEECRLVPECRYPFAKGWPTTPWSY